MNFKILLVPVLTGLILSQTSCKKQLLDQKPASELQLSEFWKTEADATIAIMGAYAAARAVFDRDYYFDGHGEYTRVRGNSATSGNILRGDAYQGANYDPTGYGGSFDKYYRYLYGAVNRSNYVIENVQNQLIPKATNESLTNLETIIAEARLLRGMTYFRLISMWGHVPYLGKVVFENAEVANLARIPIGQVKDSIMADFNYAVEKLPPPSQTLSLGRASKAAALSFRGKLNLYWGSWKKNGWPELEGFKQDQGEATAAFTAAAADFGKVVNDFGLTLYKGGDPGQIDALGKANILPNYYELFTPKANGNPEMIMVFTHMGIPAAPSQGEELMRDFSGRTIEGSQLWVHPRYEIADRYQLTTTGDFAPKLIPMNPSTNAAARTTANSTVNANSYANRDYRMKATLLWDYEMIMGLQNLKATGYSPFIYRSWNVFPIDIGGVKYTSYNTDGNNSGYIFRKFVRNYEGLGRSEGDFAWPVMRLADVYLMYAEATNEVNGPQPDAIALVNKVRARGKLPELKADKTSGKQAFFNAIEQERIVELVAEGHRGFDLRRWRAIERVWGPPGSAGVWTIDTWGANITRYYQNTSDRTYQQNYIFRIPPAERDRNPNLTQNTPWL